MVSSIKSTSKPTKAAARLHGQGLTVRTMRVRIKDKHANVLLSLSREVNMVWNYDNELCSKVLEREGRFLSAFDLAAYTRGATKEGLNLHSQTVQAINEEYVTRRRQFKKAKLRWRTSYGSRRSLGWIPFKASSLTYRAGRLRMFGIDAPLSLWDSYGLSNFELGPGSLSEDASGRWYLNVTVKVKKAERSTATSAIGIDLGLKNFAALSTGKPIDAQQFFRKTERKIAVAQRAGKTRQVRNLHAKTKNQRKDFSHQNSTAIVSHHGAIFVGNVNATALVQTRMAKSVLDAGWSMFKTMLQYKCDDAGVWFGEVNEAYSTQDCSACFARSGPKGLKDLGIREWTCMECGTCHDRDVNAARNILRRGLATLVVGIPALAGGAEAKFAI